MAVSCAIFTSSNPLQKYPKANQYERGWSLYDDVNLLMGRVAKGKHAFQANGLGVERMTIMTPTQTSADERTDTRHPVPLAPSILVLLYHQPPSHLNLSFILLPVARKKSSCWTLEASWA